MNRDLTPVSTVLVKHKASLGYCRLQKLGYKCIYLGDPTSFGLHSGNVCLFHHTTGMKICLCIDSAP